MLSKFVLIHVNAKGVDKEVKRFNSESDAREFLHRNHSLEPLEDDGMGGYYDILNGWDT